MIASSDIIKLQEDKATLRARIDGGDQVSLCIGFEWDNQEDIVMVDAIANITRVLRLLGTLPDYIARPVEVLVVYNPALVGSDFEAVLHGQLQPISNQALLKVSAAEGASYYAMKNAAAHLASGDLLALMDCDCTFSETWFQDMLDDFIASDALVVSGRTMIGGDTFLARAMSLLWIFPVKGETEKEINRRVLNANAMMLPRRLMVQLPFPDVEGGRIHCSLWRESLEQLGGKVGKGRAVATHNALDTFSAIIERAWLFGSDADRHCFHRKSVSRVRRTTVSAGRFIRQMLRSIRRNISMGRSVGLAAWQIPASIAVAFCFHSVAFAAQLQSALFGLRRRQPATEIRAT